MSALPTPASTRERILGAAIEEFSAVGFAGARVDAIARRAGCNKQLLYHHFTDKDGLYGAVIEAVLAEKRPPLAVTLAGLLDAVHEHYLGVASDPRWIRMMQWEALERGGEPSTGCDQRRRHLREEVERFRELQRTGAVRDDVAPELLLLQVIALVMAPHLLPQLVHLMAGAAPGTADTGERYGEALRSAVERLLSR